MSRTAIFLTVFFAVWLTACSRDSFERVQASAYSSSGSDIEIENFTGIGFEGDRTDWDLQGDYAVVFEQKQETHIFKIKMLYYGNEKEATDIKADKAVLYEADRNMHLTGNVIVKAASGRTLYTEELKWSDQDQELRSDRPVKIVMTSGDVITGTGLVSDRNLSKIVMPGGQGYHPGEQ